MQIQLTEGVLAKAEKVHKRQLYVSGAIILVICMALLLSACRRSPVTQAPTPMPPTPTFAETVPPAFTPEPTAIPTAAPTATPTHTPAPSVTPTPEVAAIVGADGAGLRPGATTWWYPQKTLPAGIEVELAGADPDFPGWVYIRTEDGAEGWTQVEKLEIHRDLNTLPRVTPRPTLEPALTTPTPTPPAPTSCTGGALKFSYWVMSRDCNADGTWTANVFAAGEGGNCIYTYLWEGKVVGGPQPGPLEFGITQPRGLPIMGSISVVSAGQEVIEGLVVAPPQCP